MAEQHDRILGYFLEEASEHLQTIEQGLLKLPETVKQPNTIRELFRAAHSIKGSAAMLGLRDIQKVADRFESNFKLLKEHPQIAVDNQLKSLFLESFGFLSAGIEEVRLSSDPYHQDPDTPNPIGDPVFEELRSYLQQLLADTEPTVTESTNRDRDRERDPALDRVFGEYVTNKLAELLELCLQIDSPEIRTQIQQICQKLGKLGENFEYLEWTNLFAACRLAIANPTNSLPSLGETLAIAIKQAQVLVLADRHQAITITPDLEAAIAIPDRMAGVQPQTANGTTASLPVDSANETTWKLDDRMANTEESTYQLQQTPELISLSADFDAATVNFSAIPEAEFDADAMELNEFMNLLSDDMPTEGSWIQDEDFFDVDLPMATTAEQSTSAPISTVNEPTLEPAAMGLVDSADFAAAPTEYDEETFYNPDLGDIDEREIINFWSDAQLAATQSLPLYSELDLLDSPDRQLQPDLSPAIDLIDIPAPDFSLDRPMSELFSNATPDISDTKVASTDGEDLQSLLSSDPAAHLVDANDFHPDFEAAPIVIDGDDNSATHSHNEPIAVAAIHSEATLTDEQIDLPAGGDLHFATQGADSSDDRVQLEPSYLSADATGAFSDVLLLEELNSPEPIQSTSEANELHDFFNDLDPESNDWNDNLFDRQEIGDMSDLNLDLFDDRLDNLDVASDDDANESVFNSITMSSDFTLGNELAPKSDLEDRLQDLNPWADNLPEAIGDENLAALSPNSIVADDNFDRDSLNIDDLAANADLCSEPMELDIHDSPVELAPFDLLDRNDLSSIEFNSIDGNNAEPSFAVELPDRSLELDLPIDNNPHQNSFNNNDLTDLNISPLTSSELESLPVENINHEVDAEHNQSSGKKSGIDVFESNDLSGLNLSPLVGDTTLENNALGDVFVDLDLGFLDASEPVGELSFGDNLLGMNLDFPIESETIGTETDNLDIFNIDNLNGDVHELETVSEVENALPSLEDLNFTPNDDFSNLNIDNLGDDLNHLSAGNLDLAGFDVDDLVVNLDHSNNETSPSLQFADLADLSIDLDNLGGHEALDLDNLLAENPQSNLDDLGGLDALLGVTSVGVGGAVAIGASTLDDLDALVSDAAPNAGLDDLDALLGTPAPVVTPPTDPKNTADRRPKQSRKFEQTMKVSVKHLDNLNNLVGELVVNRNTLEQDQNRMRQFVEKLLSEVQKLNEVGKRMQDLYERSLMENSLIASRQQSKPAVSPSNNLSDGVVKSEELSGISGIEYDPLEMDRFTPIHLLSQKMIELTVRVRESTADIEFVVDGSTEVTRTLRQITGQLQEDLTKSRMLPFAQTADRLQRGVRDNGLKYGKQIELSVEGRDTLIDKVILESLAEPLMHMANNAIAHGIESAESRTSLGKSPEGKITLRAIHQGNQTIISMSDDGAGIDTDRVKQKAIDKGIITPHQAATMSKSEAYDLLFLPSFSTKDQADELSGRGVGMDVVRTSINEIRGTITTESQLGVGTTFTIRLPLALSIAKALIAVNDKSNIAFPMDGIEDTQDVSPEQIQTNSEGQQCIFWRDELIPVTPLSELLAFNRPIARNNFYSSNEDDSDLVSILILRSDGQFTAVQVDKISGDREIVIKPLQGPASKPLGIAGATVLGDGRIVPIADVMELIALAKGTLTRQVWVEWTDEMAIPVVQQRESSVLIVDDSITVRELLSLTFKRAGYQVEQARDGQEAWDKLRAGLPCDIVFCDIEMPRMDGLEFLSRIQKDPALSKVPVAMLTSRGSDRHRQIASQLGASGYFIKPYLEEALLDAAKRMIKGEVLEIV